MTTAVIIASILLALYPVAWIGAAARWPGTVPVPRFIAAWLEELPPPPPLRILDRLTLPLRLMRRPTGQHAAPLRVDLATTGTIPVVRTTDRPPWTTQPFPEVTP